MRIKTRYGHCLAIKVDKELHVMDVWVDADARGRGHGTELVRRALAWGKAKGCRKAVLHTKVSNLGMQALARKFGFAVVADELHMEADLA